MKLLDISVRPTACFDIAFLESFLLTVIFFCFYCYAGVVLLLEVSWWKHLSNFVLRLRYGVLYRNPPPSKTARDDDVLQEEQLVKQYCSYLSSSKGGVVDDEVANETVEESVFSRFNALTLLIDRLVKTYPPMNIIGGKPKFAVRGMSLACYEGERFGLLGINGAGKTTSLGVLTGEIQSSAGEVYIGGKPLRDPATMTMIGYCPQVDPLLDLMNAYETLVSRFFHFHQMPLILTDSRRPSAPVCM